MHGKRSKLRRFASMFGRTQRGPDGRWINDRKLCAGFALVCLTFAVVLGDYIGRLTFEEPQPASFVLESAESVRRERGKRHEIDVLRLNGTEGESYSTEDDAMKFSEIQDAVEFLRPGMQMEVLVGADGVRQIVADGQMILSEDVAAGRTALWHVLYWCVGIFFLIYGLYLSLRTVALLIKQKKGWKF